MKWRRNAQCPNTRQNTILFNEYWRTRDDNGKLNGDRKRFTRLHLVDDFKNSIFMNVVETHFMST